MRVKFNGGDSGGRVVVGDRDGFASRGRATVEDASLFFRRADKSGDELRAFVVDGDFVVVKRFCFRHVSGEDATR